MRRTRMAGALAAALALASGAYAIGTQTGGGSATAQSSDRSAEQERDRVECLPGPDLDEKAKELGVSTDELERALAEVRGQLRSDGDPREEHAEKLAKALGVDAGKVNDALERVRPRVDRAEQPPPPGPGLRMRVVGPPVAELAKALNLGEDKVRDAFEKVRSEHRAAFDERHDRFVEALAKELNLSAEKVGDVFDGPPLPPHGGPSFGARFAR